MILAIIQARMSSSRLPGKVLRPILGEPMLFRQIERVKRAKLIDQLIVATSDEKSDDVIAEFCKDMNIYCYRGSLDDVLARYYHAAKRFNPDYVVRLTADCPLADPNLIDEVISFALKNEFDYASNVIERTFPDGLDIEVVKFSCLEEAFHKATTSCDREHVTSYIYNNESCFKIGSYTGDWGLSDWRWTVDNLKDYEFAKKIYEELYPINPNFLSGDIIAFLKTHSSLIHKQ